MSFEEMAIFLVDYDTRWPDRYLDEHTALRSVLARDVLIEHIGSTAIPGMRAKPVIDIMVLIGSIRDAPTYFGPLETLGYHYFPYSEDRTPERRWFCKPDLQNRTHHLHLVEAGTDTHRGHLAFRDFLRAHPDHAARYQSFKEALAATHPDDREAYTEGKGVFIREIEALARAWADDPGS